MQNAEWISLFRQLPTEFHSQVVLMLNNRSELSVETILRVDPSYLLIRGRTAGTTDGGLPYLIPYAQLSAIYLYRQIKEAEVETIFGALRVAASSRSNQGAVTPLTVSATPPPPAPLPPPPVPQTAMPAFGRPTEATAVARNNLLERLRAARQAAQPFNGK